MNKTLAIGAMGTDDKRYTVRHPRNEVISKPLRCRILICILCLFNFRVVAIIMSPSGRLTTRGIWSHTPVVGLSASTGLGRGNSLPPLSSPLIELITPDSCSSSADVSKLIHSVKKALDGGVKLVQLRDRKSDSQSIAKLACILRDSTREKAWFVINGDPQAARAWGADGVHLPEHMMDRLTSLRGSGKWPRLVGCSVHSAEAAVNAARLGVDYVQVWHDLVGRVNGEYHYGNVKKTLAFLQIPYF